MRSGIAGETPGIGVLLQQPSLAEDIIPNQFTVLEDVGGDYNDGAAYQPGSIADQAVRQATDDGRRRRQYAHSLFITGLDGDVACDLDISALEKELARRGEATTMGSIGSSGSRDSFAKWPCKPAPNVQRRRSLPSMVSEGSP